MPSLNRSLLATALFAAVGVLSASATTYTLTMSSTASPGGYWVDPDGALEGVLANYGSQAKSVGGTRFWSMCVETDEYFWPGAKYNGTISGSIANGGGSNTNSGDPISVGTAYLYKQFALGNLDTLISGFTYNTAGGARVQNTVWALENEAGKVADTILTNHLLSVFGSIAAYSADYSGHEVQVLHLTRYDGPGGDGQTAYGTARQDQLILSHVPDTASTLTLIGGAFLLISLSRRRFV